MHDRWDGFGERIKRLNPLWSLGKSMSLGALNDFAPMLSLLLLLEVFYRELDSNVQRTRLDLIESATQMIAAMILEFEVLPEQVERLVEGLLWYKDPELQQPFLASYYDEKNALMDTHTFRYLKEDRYGSDWAKGGKTVYQLTEEALEIIFMSREWVTREERALELFQEEKWLTSELGLQFLRRLGLSLADLKAKVYGEPFVYWPRPGISLSEAKQLLIVENLSMFHTCKRALEQGLDLYGLIPDAIIYGEGKKIEASLPFYLEIFGDSAVQLFYAGDIDPEGWSIYARLRLKFPNYSIQLAASLYQGMAELASEPYQSFVGQQANELHFSSILQELSLISAHALRIINQCWTEQKRIPQEVITIETLQQRKGVDSHA